ncbi:winged helix DNA-binding protein [Asanoa sp. WMMD1127]|uniref:winged helix DNA-binding protein n=1 Tax=Asanoa sp. WMMD1127 TaxID=3016107 RepID=UPI00241756E3|nr:winged helix DNA-binding protein [Asanoa sp. WMMD1127]MDG4822679.1 winged helix DNA-binding protein [Asanoa sp. WMMD1127]
MGASAGAAGIEELRDAVAAIGLAIETSGADSTVDGLLVNPAGGPGVPVRIKRISLAAAEGLDRKLAQWAGAEAAGRSPAVQVLVADRVTEQAREVLRRAGWSWLDLRGHLHLAAQGLFVDASVPRLSALPERSSALAGRVATEVATWLLLHPDKPAAVREIARNLERSASSVSRVVGDLRAAGLVTTDGKPAIPELFWQLADAWKPVHLDVARAPSTSDDEPVSDALRLGLGGEFGWALTDTMAAAAYGAPVGTRSDYPPDFYVPDQTVLRRAGQLLGVAPSRETRAASLRVAPLPLVVARRVLVRGEVWPLARPLFVALDLAADPGRGREVLEAWTPPSEVGRRVW